MKRWIRYFALLLIVLMIGVKPVQALDNEIKEIKCNTENIEAREDIEYVIETEGDNLIQLDVKVLDHNKKEISSYFENSSPPFFAGDSLGVKVKFNKNGIYYIKVNLKKFGQEDIVHEKEYKVNCGNVIEKTYTTKKDNSKKQEDKKTGNDNNKKAKGDKIAYLTFDDGPSAVTIEVLDVLDRYNIKATFFVLGRNAENNKKILKMIHDGGHVIGNHTYSHEYNYIYSDVDHLIGEIKKTDEIIKSVIEGYDRKLFRFPGGSFHRTKSKKAVDELGYKHFNWHIDSGDTRAALVPAYKIEENVINNIWRDKIVILFHDAGAKKTTPEALPGIIEELMDRGYRFETLVEDSFDSF